MYIKMKVTLITGALGGIEEAIAVRIN